LPVKILLKDAVINSRKFDNTISKSWKADLIEKEDSLLVFKGVFENVVDHSILGIIRPGTVSYEFYWLDGWFNVFRFHDPDGKFLYFYCNLNMPPVFENGVLDYIDLDIDVIVYEDFSYKVLDRDEFASNAEKYRYTENLKEKVGHKLDELIRLIENRDFPFDYKGR
jgi:protein associated with RNAse G/E